MRHAVLSLGCLLLATNCLAQSSAPERRLLLARRAAEADAYRKLADAIGAIQIDADLRVRDAAAESTGIRAEVDEFLRGAKLGEPVFDDDGTCEVTAEITVAPLAKRLRSIRAPSGVPDSDAPAERKTLRVTGRGISRAELPPGLPTGIMKKLGPPPAASDGRAADDAGLPEIWNAVSGRERIMAIDAARKDAQRKLAERVGGLRVSSRSLVRDAAAENDVVVTDLVAHLVGARETGLPYYHDGCLIVEVEMTLPAESVVTAVRSLHERRDGGAEPLSPPELEKRLRVVVKHDISAVGVGMPRGDVLRQIRLGNAAAGPASVTRGGMAWPVWAEQELTAEARGGDAELSTPQGKLRAARAAESAAPRKLADVVAALPLDAEKTVGEFTDGRDEIGLLLDALVGEADVTATRFDADGANVAVSVSGMRVWDVLNDGLRGR